MLNVIKLKILKIIHKVIPSKTLRKKIDDFDVSIAYQTIKKLKKVSNNNISLKKIKTILFLSDINLNVKNDNFYYHLLDLVSGNGNILTNKLYLKGQLQNKKLKSAGLLTWLRLRNLFYLKNEMVLGGVCRKNAIKYAIKNKQGIFLSSKDKARARIDASLNLNKSEKNFKSFPLEYNFDQIVLSRYISSINNIKFHQNKHDIENNEFFNMFKNKSVAIVGPSKTYKNDANEIDSFDIVVRLNYTFSKKNLDKLKKGVKIDVSYFNGEQIDYLIANENSKLPNELKVACIKDRDFTRKKNLEIANPNKIVREIINFNILNFYSSHNLLALAILDILQTERKKIKVFHSDLFLSSIRESKYYPSSFNRSDNKLKKLQVESFIDHDPMMQHEFLQKLYKLNIITGDDVFNEVMKLDTYEYLNKLEDVYK